MFPVRLLCSKAKQCKIFMKSAIKKLNITDTGIVSHDSTRTLLFWSKKIFMYLEYD